MKIYCAFGVKESKPKQSQFSNRKTDDRRQKAEYGPSGYGPATAEAFAETSEGLPGCGGLRPDERRDESGLVPAKRGPLAMTFFGAFLQRSGCPA